MFKVNNKDTRTTSLVADFTRCSGVSIGDFEQVSAGWNLNLRIQNNFLVSKKQKDVLLEVKSYQKKKGREIKSK